MLFLLKIQRSSLRCRIFVTEQTVSFFVLLNFGEPPDGRIESVVSVVIVALADLAQKNSPPFPARPRNHGTYTAECGCSRPVSGVPASQQAPCTSGRRSGRSHQICGQWTRRAGCSLIFLKCRLSASSWYTTLGAQLRSPVIGRPSNRSRNCKNGNAREK